MGGFFVLDLSLKGQGFRFVNVYLPNVERERCVVLRRLYNLLNSNRVTLLGGDFNFVENLGLDKCGEDPLAGDGGTRVIRSIKNDFSLVDVFRTLYPTRRAYSFSAQGVSTRLDRFYLSSTVVGCVRSTSLIPCTITDHSIAELTFDDRLFGTYSHGPGFWKFNVSLLKEASLVEGVEALWNVLKGSQIKNGIWWENCKFTFKRFLLSYSRKKAYQDKKQTRVLLAQIGLFEELAIEDPPFFAAILSDLKASLNSLTEMKARGAQVRSRSVYLDTEEKPCSYFLRRESARSKDKFIFELCDDSGRLYRDPLSLQWVCRNFYKELLSESPVDDDSIDDLLGAVPTLGGDARLSCEGPLSYEEGLKAVRGMKRDKSPGLDGLPAEFYKRFFYLFGRDFVSMVNGCLVQGELPLSLRTGLITLIPKDDSNKSFLKYWRPISLLYVDYKIISKALSNRLAGVLHYVISEDQTCSVPGRSISDNLHLVRGVFDFLGGRNISCGLVNFDQKKAFDRVSHRYMFLTFQAFGFGPSFISWVKLLYTNVFSSVLVNGFVTAPFSVTRSVRQGCGLSPLLYVLCIEPLAHSFRMNPRIRGLSLPGCNQTLKVTQYVDDTTCVIADVPSLKAILEVFAKYEKASGAALNLEKCVGMWISGAMGGRDSYCRIPFVVSMIKCLGFFFSPDRELMMRKNWEVVYNKCDSVIKGFRGDGGFRYGDGLLLLGVCYVQKSGM